MNVSAAILTVLMSGTAGAVWTPPDTAAQRASQRERDAAREIVVRRQTAQESQRLRETRAQAGADDTRYRQLRDRLDELTRLTDRRRANLAGQRGAVYDIYVAARQAAGDLAAQLQRTTTAPPESDPGASAQQLAANPRPLSLEELGGLWEWLHLALTHGATHSLERLTVQVAPTELATRDVLRLGSVAAFAGDQPAQFDPLTRLYRVRPAASPAVREIGAGLATIRFEPLSGAAPGAPGPAETLRGAGPIGWLIVGLGATGALLLLLRLALVLRLRRGRRDADDARAHLVAAERDHRDEDSESVAAWVNTAVRREVRRLLWGHTALKVIIATAPLLGLLGTVTGMIVMFRQLNIYGSGDPVLMAGGIAQALSTTLLGLLVAIPLLLGHRWVCALADQFTHELDVQAAGLVAAYRERQ